MDFGSLTGLALAAVAVFGGQAIEGGEIGFFLQPAAIVIVVLGTLAAVLLHNPFGVFLRGMRMAAWALRPPASDARESVRKLAGWAHIARQEGVLALERQLEFVADPYLRNGLQLLVDATEPDKLREAMEIHINTLEGREYQAARIWEAAGGYAPTLGIIGAVMGLIQVMENLSEPHMLGPGIAVAFVSTLYGVGLANLVFLPLANKLKILIARRGHEREMLCEGLVGIARGENPRLIEQRMQNYL